MNRWTVCLFLILVSTLAFAQEEQGREEVDLLKQIIELQELKINSYEKTLNLLASKPVQQHDGVEYKVQQVLGSRSTNTLVVNGVMLSHRAAVSAVQAGGASAIDSEGNRLSAGFNIELGSFIRLEDFPVNVPVKFKITFNTEFLDVAKLKALHLFIINEKENKDELISFENMDILWNN